jgi:hypothetical protein
MIRQHDIYRTRFYPFQNSYIACCEPFDAATHVKFKYEANPKLPQADLKTRVKKEATFLSDLSNDVPISMHCYDYKDNGLSILMHVSLMVCDVYSLQQIAKFIITQSTSVTKTPHFSSFASLSNYMESSPEYTHEKFFWQRLLDQCPSTPALVSGSADEMRIEEKLELDPEFMRKVTEFCKQIGVSMDAFFLGLIHLTLLDSKVLGQNHAIEYLSNRRFFYPVFFNAHGPFFDSMVFSFEDNIVKNINIKTYFKHLMTIRTRLKNYHHCSVVGSEGNFNFPTVLFNYNIFNVEDTQNANAQELQLEPDFHMPIQSDYEIGFFTRKKTHLAKFSYLSKKITPEKKHKVLQHMKQIGDKLLEEATEKIKAIIAIK